MKKKIGIITLIFLALVTILYLNKTEILNLPMTILVSDDEPEKGADYIFIMMGNVAERAAHAAHLYKEGFAQKIIFAEAESSDNVTLGFKMKDGQATRMYLSKLGIPDDKIIFLDQSTNSSSQEEVQLVLKFIKETDLQAKRIILVTSWYHSSRAAWILDKSNTSDITIDSSPSPSPKSWWHQEGDFLAVFNEYLKWTYYLIKY